LHSVSAHRHTLQASDAAAAAAAALEQPLTVWTA